MQRQKSRVFATGEDPGGSSSESEIPATSDEFLRKVSSESYTNLSKQMQEKEEASFEVLERDPWGEDNKMVYVLAQKEESLFTMKVRKDRSDVENEFTTLFPSIGSRQRWKRPEPAKPPAGDEQEPTARFSMHVDTVSEGILVFEDEDEATRFCGLLETDGRQDLSVVETDAPGLFSLCQRSKAVAILFRQGVMPPLPDRLQRALRARKFSLDD
ncbi:hypothetical protein KFL_003220120 [Klebsormidium nitens]|uniref:Uncharacterized protein n=1 Tax=Klebsormidium nitens TaxID=105231 RepID=A0A1Y1I7M8_KLENI|nr:hypothetical protein KFL_003220120 [Klebsormidium nitens]|eukprot:GAQ86950.1 hypothetical protein KFL_003220120 [Klebsormidium nitens]